MTEGENDSLDINSFVTVFITNVFQIINYDIELKIPHHSTPVIVMVTGVSKKSKKNKKNG